MSLWATLEPRARNQTISRIEHRMLPVPNTIHDVRMNNYNADEPTKKRKDGHNSANFSWLTHQEVRKISDLDCIVCPHKVAVS